MKQFFGAGLAVVAVLAASVSDAAERSGYEWTGLYVGATGGVNFGRADVNSLFLPHSPNNDVLSGADTHRIKTFGPAFGAQVGFNYDLAHFVFGIEAEFGAFKTDNQVTSNLVFTGSGANAGAVTDRVTSNWLATSDRGSATASTSVRFTRSPM